MGTPVSGFGHSCPDSLSPRSRLLANWGRSPTFAPELLRGNYDVHWLQEFSARLDAGNGAFGFDVFDRELCLHPGAAAACTGDAFQFCGPEIPDVDRVTACMIRNKSRLSAGCRAHFRAGPEPSEAAATPAGRPMSIKPATREKARQRQGEEAQKAGQDLPRPEETSRPACATAPPQSRRGGAVAFSSPPCATG